MSTPYTSTRQVEPRQPALRQGGRRAPYSCCLPTFIRLIPPAASSSAHRRSLLCLPRATLNPRSGRELLLDHRIASGSDGLPSFSWQQHEMPHHASAGADSSAGASVWGATSEAAAPGALVAWDSFLRKNQPPRSHWPETYRHASRASSSWIPSSKV